MEQANAVIVYAKQYVDTGAQFVDGNPVLIIAFCAVVALFSLFARNLLNGLLGCLLAAIALLCLLNPSHVASIVAIGSLAGSILAIFLGRHTQLREAATREALNSLKASVGRLEASESRRFMASLNPLIANGRTQSLADQSEGAQEFRANEESKV
jgi:hypothetical protein